jgi:hypothetical protein
MRQTSRDRAVARTASSTAHFTLSIARLSLLGARALASTVRRSRR